MKHEWRYNDDTDRWCYGYQDVDRDTFVLLAAISSELLDDEDPDYKRTVALACLEKIGSVPPPLQEYVPERL